MIIIDISNGEELLNIIAKNSVFIFGAGYIAKRCYYAIKRRALCNNYKGFVTTSGSDDCIDGYEVKAIKSVTLQEKDKSIFLIAVHESMLEEVELVLKQNGVRNYIFITPYQYLLQFGEPCEYGADIEIAEIIEGNKNYYSLAIRYLAVENYYGINNCGYDIYRECMAFNCSVDTAKKRLERYINLIESYEKNGYIVDKPIILTGSKSIIDGNHRLALAIYHRLRSIKADIYDISDVLEVHGENALITDKTILECEMTTSKKEIIIGAQNRLRKAYGLD